MMRERTLWTWVVDAAVVVAGLAATATILGVWLDFAYGSVDAVVRYANLGAALVEAPLAMVAFSRKRAPWAFLITLGGVMLIFNLLAASVLVHAGSAGIVGIGLGAVRALAFVVLAASGRQFRGAAAAPR